MKIIVNGDRRTVSDQCTIADLLQKLDISGRLAVEVNEEIVARSRFEAYCLQSNDRVEIVHAIGGG